MYYIFSIFHSIFDISRGRERKDGIEKCKYNFFFIKYLNTGKYNFNETLDKSTKKKKITHHIYKQYTFKIERGRLIF